MPARRTVPVRSKAHVDTPAVADETTQRALERLVDAVQALQAKSSRDLVKFDLVNGTNKVPHGLGRACSGYNVVPTVLDVTFAHAIDFDNPRPDLEVWIVVTGGPQPGAVIEVY